MLIIIAILQLNIEIKMKKLLVFALLSVAHLNSYSQEALKFAKYDCFISADKKSSIIQFNGNLMTYENNEYKQCDVSDIKGSYSFKLNCNSTSEAGVFIRPKSVYGNPWNVTIADSEKGIKEAVCYPIHDAKSSVKTNDGKSSDYNNWK